MTCSRTPLAKDTHQPGPEGIRGERLGYEVIHPGGETVLTMVNLTERFIIVRRLMPLTSALLFLSKSSSPNGASAPSTLRHAQSPSPSGIGIFPMLKLMRIFSTMQLRAG